VCTAEQEVDGVVPATHVKEGLGGWRWMTRVPSGDPCPADLHVSVQGFYAQSVRFTSFSRATLIIETAVNSYTSFSNRASHRRSRR